MKLKIKKLIFVILWSVLLFTAVSAQEKINVVTRTVYKSFVISSKGELNIKAEKATIIIKPSKDNNIHLKLQIISKNPSRKIAEEDLKYCDYKIENRGEMFLVSNFFNFKNDYKDISSNLSARYEIELPEKSNLIVSNIYGDIYLSGISGNVNVKSNFGQIYLSSISGSLQIQSSFTDISGEKINSLYVLKTENGEIKLAQLNEIGNIRSHFGSIQLSQVNSSVTINADMAQVNIELSDLDRYSFKLLAQKDKIFVPFDLKKSITFSKENSILNYVKGKVIINVTTNYSSINLK